MDASNEPTFRHVVTSSTRNDEMRQRRRRRGKRERSDDAGKNGRQMFVDSKPGQQSTARQAEAPGSNPRPSRVDRRRLRAVLVPAQCSQSHPRCSRHLPGKR